MSIDWIDAEELAAAACGLPDDYDGDAVEKALFDKFEVSVEQFHKIAEALIKFTPPQRAAISCGIFRGFVKDDFFICKEKV